MVIEENKKQNGNISNNSSSNGEKINQKNNPKNKKSNNKNVSKYMKKAIKTFINMEKYILNAFDYEYSNGIVEGTNNLIKQIKHTAYGYRKFNHLKARVMLIKGLLNPIKTY